MCFSIFSSTAFSMLSSPNNPSNAFVYLYVFYGVPAWFFQHENRFLLADNIMIIVKTLFLFTANHHNPPNYDLRVRYIYLYVNL